MTPRDIHGKAEIAREKGDFGKSLEILSRAIVAYQKNSDYLGVSDALNSVFLTYKHLYYLQKDDVYKVLAKHAVEAAVTIAEEKCGESARALPYYNLAQYLDEFESNYKKAIDYYKKAINIMKTNLPEEHKVQLPGYLYNMSVHMHESEFKDGDKSAIDRLEDTTKKISSHPHKFERDVWMSGGYMKIAFLLKDSDRRRSVKALKKAKDIIDANDKLTIRKRQWEELAKLVK